MKAKNYTFFLKSYIFDPCETESDQKESLLLKGLLVLVVSTLQRRKIRYHFASLSVEMAEMEVLELEKYLKLPHWMTSKEKAKYQSRLTNSNTNSSTGTIRRYGEVIAVRVVRVKIRTSCTDISYILIVNRLANVRLLSDLKSLKHCPFGLVLL